MFGPFDENIRIIRAGNFTFRLWFGTIELKISGDGEQVMYAERRWGLLSLCARGEPINEQNISLCAPAGASGARRARSVSWPDVICVYLGIGPAGTGKTYLAVAMAVAALRPGKSTGSF